MVQFESLRKVSYSHSVVTAAVSTHDRDRHRTTERPRLCVASRGKKM